MICPSCGEENRPGQRFCGNCGHRLEETFLMPGREVRKTVTVVFCDPGVTRSRMESGGRRRRRNSNLAATERALTLS